MSSVDPDSQPDTKVGLLGPRSLERPTDSGATVVAVLDQPVPFLVDGGGLVQAADASWSLDWWIGADDRWYAPAREASVRQRRRGAGPVLDTSIRVPSGDVTHTCYSVSDGGSPVAVVEVANDSPVPVALVFAVRPYDIGGSVHRPAMRWISDRELEVDGLRLTLPRPPNERGLSESEDLWSTVGSGQPLTWHDQVGTAGNGFHNGLIMFPLPHGTTLRVSLGPIDQNVALEALPEADNVAKGWNAVVDSGGRFDLPDPGVGELASAARARLLLADQDMVHRLASQIAANGGGLVRRLLSRNEPGPVPELQVGEVVAGLAESGHHDRLGRWLYEIAEALSIGSVGDEPVPVAEFVDAMARSAVLARDRPAAEMLLEPLARLTKQLESEGQGPAGPWETAAAGLLALIDHLGQVEAANGLRRRLETAVPPVASEQELIKMAQGAHSSGRWSASVGGPAPTSESDSVIEAARFWRAARRHLLREDVRAVEPTVELLPEFPASWRGGPVEVHEAPTLYGTVSFAVRWHGARPALLWDQLDGTSALTCPSLDPEWRTTESKGETLLAGVAEGLDDIPAPGDSFI